MNNTLKDGVSKEARSQLYADAEKQLQEDAALIPLYHQVEVRMVKPDIIGYSDKTLCGTTRSRAGRSHRKNRLIIDSTSFQTALMTEAV